MGLMRWLHFWYLLQASSDLIFSFNLCPSLWKTVVGKAIVFEQVSSNTINVSLNCRTELEAFAITEGATENFLAKDSVLEARSNTRFFENRSSLETAHHQVLTSRCLRM